MKSLSCCILLSFLSVATSATAVDCGKSLSRAQIEKLADAISQADSTVLQHSEGLLAELTGLAGSTRYDLVSLEHARVDRAFDLAAQVEGRLTTLVLLLNIRDGMVEAKDRALVSQYISLAAKWAHETSQRAGKSLNQLLGSLTRPGIAVDVSKVRDLATQTTSLLEACDRPTRQKGQR